MYPATPTGRCFLLYNPSRRKKILSLPGNSSANEMVSQLSQWKAATFWIPSFFQWTFYNCPSQIPPFFSKITFTSFVLQTFLWFHHSFHVLNCNSLSFPNKLIFADKITVLLFRPIPTNGQMIHGSWGWYETQSRKQKGFCRPGCLIRIQCIGEI